MDKYFDLSSALAPGLLLYRSVTLPVKPLVSRKKWPLMAIAALVLGSVPGPAAAQGGARVDRNLRQRLGALPPTALVNVIVTVRPGTRTAMCRVLEASGASITSQFSLIEAFGVRLPAAALETLMGDARVVAVSSDGPVEAAESSARPAADGTAPAVRCVAAAMEIDVIPPH